MAVVRAKIRRPRTKAEENNSCWREPVTRAIQSKIGCSGLAAWRRQSRAARRPRDKRSSPSTRASDGPPNAPASSIPSPFPSGAAPRRLLPPAPTCVAESHHSTLPGLPPKGPAAGNPPEGTAEPVTYDTAKRAETVACSVIVGEGYRSVNHVGKLRSRTMRGLAFSFLGSAGILASAGLAFSLAAPAPVENLALAAPAAVAAPAPRNRAFRPFPTARLRPSTA